MVDAVVEFDYIALEEDELTLKVGEVITNITKVSEGWCEGCLNGRKGMFPDNFVKEVKKEAKVAMPARRQNAGAVSEIRNKLRSVIVPGGPPPPAVAKKPVKKAKVTFAYVPQQEDELALEVGNIIEVLKQDEPNWWEGSLNGKVGMFPSNFVEVIGQTEADKPAGDEAPAIRGRKVEGVGFGNIFGGGPIVLRSKLEKRDSIDPSKMSADPKQPPVKLKPAVPGPAPTAAVVQPKNNTKPVLKARVMYPYSAANDDELDLTEGDIVTILDQNLEDDGWWKGELSGKSGVFPDNFVELLPVESEKPPKPVMPPPPTINNISGLKSTAVNRPMPPSSEPSKPSESKPNLETDDHKAKKNKECVRIGTLDSVKTSESALSHPTAFRVKPPVRRPPAAGPTQLREAPTPDEKVTSVAKVQPQVPVKEENLVLSSVNAPKFHRDVTHDASSPGGYATREQYAELQREVSQLRETVEQTKKSQEKRFVELMAEIDEEKKIRLNLQVEVERLKKMVTGV